MISFPWFREARKIEKYLHDFNERGAEILVVNYTIISQTIHMNNNVFLLY